MTPSRRSSSIKVKAKPVPYVMKKNFIQVLLPGKPFTLNSSHPTFKKLKYALKKRQWKKIPELVNAAQTILHYAEGQVEVEGGVVKYKGRTIQSALTDRILQMGKAGKPIVHLVKFMDNLYLNPSEKAIRSFYEWLVDNDLPITDDGCFLAYKSVDADFKDTHTKTVDNRPGQVIMMSRKVANTDYDTQCATGFHICSKQYGLYGSRVLAVKANPKHILSAVSGKMRVTQYEVLKDLGFIDRYQFQQHGFSDLEKKLVIEVSKERKEILRMLLAADPVKRLFRRKKLSKKSLVKASYARLKSMLQRFDLVPKLGPEDPKRLEKARKAAGVSIVGLAKKMGVSPKTVSSIEEKSNPTPGQESDYLYALGQIIGSKNITYKAVTA